MGDLFGLILSRSSLFMLIEHKTLKLHMLAVSFHAFDFFERENFTPRLQINCYGLLLRVQDI